METYGKLSPDFPCYPFLSGTLLTVLGMIRISVPVGPQEKGPISMLASQAKLSLHVCTFRFKPYFLGYLMDFPYIDMVECKGR